MAAKKKATILKWNPRWIKDPPPPFFKDLGKVAVRQIAQAKTTFTNRVKTVLKRAQ
jgi:hypothetical protein